MDGLMPHIHHIKENLCEAQSRETIGESMLNSHINYF